MCLCMLQHQSSDSKQVTLRGVNLRSSGTYRCEVSAEAPSFPSAQSEGRMEVVCKSLPCVFSMVARSYFCSLYIIGTEQSNKRDAKPAGKCGVPKEVAMSLSFGRSGYFI